MSIAKSLRKAGYLSVGLEGLKKYLSSLRQQQQQEELSKAAIETYSALKQNYMPEPTWEEGKTTPLQMLQPKNQQEPELPDIQGEEPALQILPDYKTKEETETDSNRIYSEYLNKISQIKGIDQEKVKQEFDMMKLKGSLLKPLEKEKVKKKIEQVDPTKTVYRVDDYGNIEVVQEGKKKKEYKSIGSYTNSEGYKKVILMDEDGNITEQKSEEKAKSEGTNIRIEMPKPEKWKEFGKALNMIMYKQDENGNLVPRPEKERSQYRTIALNFAKSNLTPEALNWYNREILSQEKWGRDDISSYDFLEEVKKGLERGELTAEAAQDLIDFDPYRSQILEVKEDQSVFRDKNKQKK